MRELQKEDIMQSKIGNLLLNELTDAETSIQSYLSLEKFTAAIISEKIKTKNNELVQDLAKTVDSIKAEKKIMLPDTNSPDYRLWKAFQNAANQLISLRVMVSNGSFTKDTENENQRLKSSLSAVSDATDNFKKLLSASRQNSGNFFETVICCIKEDIKTVNNHFGVKKIRVMVNDALGYPNSDGCINDKNIYMEDKEKQNSLINVKKLQAILDMKTAIVTSGEPLEDDLELLTNNADLIYKLRLSILNDEWDSVENILEKSALSVNALKYQVNIDEVTAVRKELKNRWALNYLNTALQKGKFVGNVKNSNIYGAISVAHFDFYIQSATAVKPTSTQVLKLLTTTKAMYKLRALLCNKKWEGDGDHLAQELKVKQDWKLVIDTADDILSRIDKTKELDSIVKDETEAIKTLAVNSDLHDELITALSNDGPITVDDGDFDLKNIDVTKLTNVCEKADNFHLQISCVSKNLLEICKWCLAIREVLLLIDKEVDSDERNTLWETVMMMINEVKEFREKEISEFSSNWDTYEKEMSIIEDHYNYMKLNNVLIENFVFVSYIYKKRSEISLQEWLQSHIAAKDFGLKEYILKLDDIIHRSRSLQFRGLRFKVAAVVNNLRQKVSSSQWKVIRKLLSSTENDKDMKVLPEAEKELSWIKGEMYSSLVMKQILEVLQPDDSDYEVIRDDDNNQEDNDSPISIGNLAVDTHTFTLLDLGAMLEMDTEETVNMKKAGQIKFKKGMLGRRSHNAIEKVLKEVSTYNITWKATKELIMCAEKIYSLRVAREDKDMPLLAQILSWFKENTEICPDVCLLEAQDTFDFYQNQQLIEYLTEELTTGGLNIIDGELDFDSIRVENLTALIERSNSIPHVLPETRQIVYAAHCISIIRNLLLGNEIAECRSYVADLIDNSHGKLELFRSDNLESDSSPADLEGFLGESMAFHPLIINEVALVRSALDQKGVFDSLIIALKSFDDDEIRFSERENKENELTTEPQSKTENKGRNRRYSYMNKNIADIDIKTVQLDLLNAALKKAEDFGVTNLYDKSKCLYDTVKIIHELRWHMREGKWVELNTLFEDNDFEMGLVKGRYHEQAKKEFLTIKCQCDVKIALIKITDALETGWASCDDGIVDIESINTHPLSQGIERLAKSIARIKESTNSPPLFQALNKMETADEVSMQQLTILLSSSEKVLSIRKMLVSGNFSLAGSVAHKELLRHTKSSEIPPYKAFQSILSELQLYTNHIDGAFELLDSFEELMVRMYDQRVNILLLEDALSKINLSLCKDNLGLIKIYNEGCLLQTSLRRFLQSIPSVDSIYDKDILEKMISKIESLEPIPAKQFHRLKSRLVKLDAFETKVKITQEDFWNDISQNRNKFRKICDEAKRMDLENHPETKLAKLYMELCDSSYFSVTLPKS